MKTADVVLQILCEVIIHQCDRICVTNKILIRSVCSDVINLPQIFDGEVRPKFASYCLFKTRRKNGIRNHHHADEEINCCGEHLIYFNTSSNKL